MATKKEETASFMLRFTQKIFQNDAGEPQVQWRGNISHVQGGEEARFSEFDDAVKFIQGKLQDLTIQAMEDKSPEEQKGILAKSFNLWKKMAAETPKMVMETLKDPKKGVAQIQDQISDQFSIVKDGLGQRLDFDSWVSSSKAESNQILEKLDALSKEMAALNNKVEKLSKQK